MNAEWWEGPINFLCNMWWLILAIIVLIIVAYLTSPYWLPLLGLALLI